MDNYFKLSVENEKILSEFLSFISRTEDKHESSLTVIHNAVVAQKVIDEAESMGLAPVKLKLSIASNYLIFDNADDLHCYKVASMCYNATKDNYRYIIREQDA